MFTACCTGHLGLLLPTHAHRAGEHTTTCYTPRFYHVAVAFPALEYTTRTLHLGPQFLRVPFLTATATTDYDQFLPDIATEVHTPRIHSCTTTPRDQRIHFTVIQRS